MWVEEEVVNEFLIWIGRKVQLLFKDRGVWVGGLGENR
jgi:hypothetical protein